MKCLYIFFLSVENTHFKSIKCLKVTINDKFFDPLYTGNPLNGYFGKQCRP